MLEFTLSLNRETYSLGEAIAFKLTLRNSGLDPQVVNTRMVVNSPLAPAPVRDVEVTVTDASGAVARFTAIIEVRILEDQDYVELKPGEMVERSFSLDLFYALERPGSYSVQAAYQSETDPGDGRAAWKGRLDSNVVTLTLVS